MVLNQSVCRETISLLPCAALLSMNSEVGGDMCVADPSVEQSSCSMDSCTGENTRSNNDDFSNWEASSEVAMVTEKDAKSEAATKVSKEEKHNTSGESDKSVMIIDLDNDTSKGKIEDHPKQPKVVPPDKKVNVMDVKDKPSDINQLSEEMISEIDKEIYKSLQKQLTMTGLFGVNKGIGGKDGKGSSRPRTPVLQRDVTASRTKPKPKLPGNMIKTGEQTIKGRNEIKLAASSIQTKKEQPTCPKKSSEVKQDQPKEDAKDEDVVWICFICAKVFGNQEELMTHQDLCDDSFTEEDTAPVNVETDTKPDLAIHNSLKTGHGSVKLELNSEKVVFPTSVIATKTAIPNPVPTRLTKVGTGIKSLPLGLPSRRFIRRKPIKEIYIPPPRETYFECLGLGQTPTVEEIFRSPRKSVSEDDCQIIDLTIEDKTQHSSPITPRSRSLMSQLSRDESTRRRHLSFSSTPVKSDIKTVENLIENDKKIVASSDSESSDSSEDEYIKRKNIPPRSALLTIPLTSPLGQRLKKHWQNDNKVPVISNIESFCKTVDQMSLLEQEAADKKNPMMEKLRHRPPPQITFRFTKKYLNKWFHKYKFNMADKQEFQKILKTGLERESRRRVKCMKPCKVVLQRLKKKDIKYWTTPRIRPVQHNYVQGFKPMVANRNLGIRSNYANYSRMRGMLRPFAPNQRMMFVQQMGRNRLQMPTLQQRLAYPTYRISGGQVTHTPHLSGPTPRLLVRPHAGMGNGMRLEVMQLNSKFPQLQSVLAKQYTQSTPHSQRRKQTFENVRTDDNLVICLSSDEEDDSNKQKVSCLKCSKGVCSQHNKLKPAGRIAEQSKVNQFKKSGQNFVSVLPRNTGANFNGGQSASQVLGSSKQCPNNQLISVSKASTVTNTPPGFISLLATNTQNHGTVNNTEESENQITITMEPEPVKSVPDLGDENSGSGRSQSDSEYMDYEVICIESDEDDDE